jgi:putative membrane protein
VIPKTASSRETDEVEPDYRFTLANERTFLAWIRTSLGSLAGGVALHELVPSSTFSGARTAIALSCMVLSFILATGAYFHWKTAQRAIRCGEPLRGTALVTIVTGALSVMAVVACLAILLS